jgi:hypothetical protein
MRALTPIPYSIRIGVTGHRWLDDPAVVEAAVRAALDADIPRLFPEEARKVLNEVLAGGKTPIAFSILTPLAEGADRVVARAVLSIPGARLDVVLPITVEDYLEDFATEESKQEFLSLLKLSRRPTQLRTRNIRDERNDPRDQVELRKDAYKAVGRYVVDHSDVLIAVWDSEPARGKGGTAEIVEYAIMERVPVIRVWNGSATVLNPVRALLPDARQAIYMDAFNRRPIPEDACERETAKLRKELFTDLEGPKKRPLELSAEARQIVERQLFPWYARASYEAGRTQRLYYFAGRSVYTLSAAAVGCAAASVLLPGLAAVGFSVELLLLVTMIAAQMMNHRKEWHRRWIEHRFLAERLRAGIFMALAGVEPRPVEVPAYMGHSQACDDWTVRTFEEIWSRLPVLTPPDEAHAPGMNRYIRKAWIAAQINYHKGKAQKEGRLRKHLARVTVFVLPVTVAAAVLHLALLAWHPGAGAEEPMHMLHHALHVGLAFVTLLFPAIAASLAGMEAHREHLRLQKRSRNMMEQLKRLWRRMAQAKTPGEFRRALEDLDEEVMLRETQDWLMLMRYVEIKAG